MNFEGYLSHFVFDSFTSPDSVIKQHRLPPFYFLFHCCTSSCRGIRHHAEISYSFIGCHLFCILIIYPSAVFQRPFLNQSFVSKNREVSFQRWTRVSPILQRQHGDPRIRLYYYCHTFLFSNFWYLFVT